MHTFDLNQDWVDEEDEEEERRLSAEALGSSDEELNGFIDYFLHGSDSDVSQSTQSRRLEESISRSRVIISRNEGMDLDFVELGLGLGLDSDTNNEAPFDLNVCVSDQEMFDLLSEVVRDVENESGESSSSSSSSWMREVELVCEEDFRVLVNESNTNNEAPELLSEVVQDVENESNINNEIQFDYNDAMMVDPPDEVDIEEGIGMIINAADEDDDGDARFFSWNNVHNEIVEDALEQFYAAADDDDDGDDMLFNAHNEILEDALEQFFEAAIEAADDDDGDDRLFSWNWNNSTADIVEGELEQFWRDFGPSGVWSELDTRDHTYISSSMQTVTCDVDNLPSVTLTQEELNNNNSICAICMENFCIEEKLKRLPCFHYYHVDCISPWLRTRNTCPTCRYELPIIC